MTTPQSLPQATVTAEQLQALLRENRRLRKEIQVAREAAEITANLVVKQFEETERVLKRFQDANAQRKAVLDSATQIAIIATDIDGLVTVFNSGAQNLLGYRAADIIGLKTPVAFHVPEELRRHAAKLAQQYNQSIQAGIDVLLTYARQGYSEQTEWIYRRKTGEHFPVSMSINALLDPLGEFNGLLCIAMDITEKKRSDKALKESERNYRLLMANIPNIVFKGYKDGSIDFFDDKIEALTGYKREAFMSRKVNWPDLVLEADQPGVRAALIQALKGDKQYIREYRIRKKNGEVIWVEAGNQIICDAAGEIEFITGAFLDITERKAAEKALHQSEEKYRSLFAGGPNPIFVLDRQTLEILDANPSAEQTYGYAKAELIGRCFTDLGRFEYEHKTFAEMGDSDWSQGCVVSQKIRHYKKGHQPFYTKVKACPAQYKNRHAIILAATDITETVEKDAQLFQAGKMTTLGEMSAGIAHELNQPLNAIKIGNEYLKKMVQKGRAVSEKDLLAVTTAVTGQVERASDIINRLREFGRKPDFKKELVNINDTLKYVHSIIGQQLILQNINVGFDLAPDLPPILANKNRLEQVVFNLVTNARDAIEQASGDDSLAAVREIRFTSFRENRQVVFTVADTGVGIAREMSEKIFEPFFTTKEVGKGMGLGLAISYGIVRDFGGSIKVESHQGQGTVFILSFPGVKETK